MMTLSRLQAHYPPRLNRRHIKRVAKLVSAKIRRSSRATVRRTRTKTRAVIRRQYFIGHAYADMRTAIAKNEDIYTAIIMLAIGISYAVTAIGAEIAFVFFQTAYELSVLSGASILVLTLIAGSVLATLGLWIAASIFSMMTTAIMQGTTGKVYRSIKRTVRRGLRAATSVTSAWICLLLILGTPLLVLASASVGYMKLTDVSMVEALGLLPYVVCTAISWVVIALMNYSLLPYVVLFEKLNLRSAITRSRKLVLRRGRIFVLFSYIALGLCAATVYYISLVFEQLIGLNWTFTFSLGLLTLAGFYTSLMTAFYRKRKLARKY